MTSLKPVAFDPNPAAVTVYDELYGMYRELHDAFGGVARRATAARRNLGTLMKRLLAMRERARRTPARSRWPRVAR